VGSRKKRAKRKDRMKKKEEELMERDRWTP